MDIGTNSVALCSMKSRDTYIWVTSRIERVMSHTEVSFGTVESRHVTHLARRRGHWCYSRGTVTHVAPVMSHTEMSFDTRKNESCNAPWTLTWTLALILRHRAQWSLPSWLTCPWFPANKTPRCWTLWDWHYVYHISIRICSYICVCVYIHMCVQYTHTHIYTYVYLYVYMCVHVCK